MRIDLPDRPAAPDLTGFSVRPYRVEDAEALRAAINEAFAGAPLFHEISPGNFREFFLNQRGTDTSLWRLAWDGGELAGYVLAWPNHGSDHTTGWVGNLGVRLAWRKRGLGGGLLRSAFGLLYDRGLRVAGLGVDAENVTGALRLYENAGMRRELRQDNWVRDL
jgi:ribosomal protein S18 acetylase RimI-like enzyme